MPKRNSWKVEKVVRKVEGLSRWASRQNDAGTRGPSHHAGMAPHAMKSGTNVMCCYFEAILLRIRGCLGLAVLHRVNAEPKDLTS
jgi:hypothetical protein